MQKNGLRYKIGGGTCRPPAGWGNIIWTMFLRGSIFNLFFDRFQVRDARVFEGLLLFNKVQKVTAPTYISRLVADPFPTNRNNNREKDRLAKGGIC